MRGRDVESTPGPKLATISSRICCFVQPCAMRLRISAFICCATAEFDSSSVSWQVGQTSSVSRSLSLGARLGGEPRRGTRKDERRREHAGDGERLTPSGPG